MRKNFILIKELSYVVRIVLKDFEANRPTISLLNRAKRIELFEPFERAKRIYTAAPLPCLGACANVGDQRIYRIGTVFTAFHVNSRGDCRIIQK